MKNYLLRIYEIRYFWLYLVKAEFENKFRRTKLGLLWVVLQPLLLTGLIAVVFGAVFGMPLKDYAPYILAGIIVWDLISSSVIIGCNSIIQAEQYIRQFNHPVTIYTLKSALVTTGTYCLAMSGLLIWTLFINPVNILLGLMTLPLTTVLFLLLSWSITTISAYTNAKYRDFPQVMTLVMQGLWYLSPVFFQKSMFTSSPTLAILFDLNPITHLLNLVREPFLYGRMPSLESYLFTLGLVAVAVFFAYRSNNANEKKVIFYL